MLIASNNGFKLRSGRTHVELFKYFLVLLLVITSASPLFSTALRSMTFLLIVLMMVASRRAVTKDTPMWALLIFVGYIISICIDVYWAVNLDFSAMSGLFMILMLFFSVIIASRIEYHAYSTLFQKVIWHLTILSLACYSIAVITPSFVSLGIAYEYYGYPGKSFGFQNFIFQETTLVFRNSGFASEPGVFQIFINAAIALGLHDRKVSVFKLVVFGIALLTSASTAGLIIYFILLILRSSIKVKFIALVVSMILFASLLQLISSHYTAKILGENAFRGRVDPAVSALKIFADHPFAYGSVRYTQNFEYLEIGSWDSYTQSLVRFGLTGFLVLIFLLARLSRKQFALSLVFSLSFATNSLFYIPAIAVFFFFPDYRPSTYRHVKPSLIFE